MCFLCFRFEIHWDTLSPKLENRDSLFLLNVDIRLNDCAVAFLIDIAGIINFDSFNYEYYLQVHPINYLINHQNIIYIYNI
jgi:hypothetical protein